MRIAIVKLSAMGDIIHAMVALQYIKLFKNDVEIDWIVEQGFAKLLEGNPDIHRIYPVELKGIKTRNSQLFSEVKRVQRYALKGYDLVIDAQGLMKSAIVSKLLGKNRAGFSKNSIREGVASYFYTQKVEIAYDANTIDRNARVLSEPLGLEISREMILDKKPFLFYQKDAVLSCLAKDKKNIIFVIGSTWESRNYPKEQFMEVANFLKENVLIVWGNEEEKSRAEWIASHSDYATVLPKINLNGLKAIIAEADLLIGNDTGPTHIAWGMNVPSITLFGPTPTNRVYETRINKVLSSDSIVNHYKLNKEDFSIKEIAVEAIVSVGKKLLYA
jgi:heptosyltransferase-1